MLGCQTRLWTPAACSCTGTSPTSTDELQAGDGAGSVSDRQRTAKLVMGASGYLGSHVTRQLVEQGADVRVWGRPTSASRAFADLPVAVTRYRGDLFDDEALQAAMCDVATVFYCIVDARAWLHDPTPLFRANVEALQHALDAAVKAGVERFIFCSTVGTIGHPGTGLATEETPHCWAHLGGAYITSRVDAENLVLRYRRERAWTSWCSARPPRSERGTTARWRTAISSRRLRPGRCRSSCATSGWRSSMSTMLPARSSSQRSAAAPASGTSSPNA